MQCRRRRGRRPLPHMIKRRAGVPIWRGLELREARCVEERELSALARCLGHGALQERGCADLAWARGDYSGLRGSGAVAGARGGAEVWLRARPAAAVSVRRVGVVDPAS